MIESPTKPEPKHGWWGAVVAILLQRCPRCREGLMFRGLLAMNDPCPVCGLLFQREEGSFLGAMYFSYVLASMLMGAFYFLAVALWPGLAGPVLASIAVLAYVPFVPMVFRYSRVLWVHLDRADDFSDILAAPYEKARLRQIAEAKREPPPAK